MRDQRQKKTDFGSEDFFFTRKCKSEKVKQREREKESLRAFHIQKETKAFGEREIEMRRESLMNETLRRKNQIRARNNL